MTEARENRVPFMMSDRELGEIDDWRFENRVATRADALRRLCKLGLELDSQLAQLKEVKELVLAAATQLQSTIKAEDQTKNRQKSAELALASLKLSRVVDMTTKKAQILKEQDYPEVKLQELDSQSESIEKAFKVLEKNLELRKQ